MSNDIKSILDDLRRKQADAQGEVSKVNQEISALKARVRAGETTGDRLGDYLLVAGYDQVPEAVACYTNLKKRAEEHQGQFILFIENSMNMSTPNSPAKINSSCRLGILTKAPIKIDLEAPKLGLAIESYHLHWWDERSFKALSVIYKTEMVLGSNSGAIGLFTELTETLKDIGHGSYPRSTSQRPLPPTNALEIYIGDEEVMEWFAKNDKFMDAVTNMLRYREEGSFASSHYDAWREKKKSQLLKDLEVKLSESYDEEEIDRLKKIFSEARDFGIDKSSILFTAVDDFLRCIENVKRARKLL